MNKTKKIIAIIFLFICIGAKYDQPIFIKRIPGEEFIVLWVIYFAGVFGAAVVLYNVIMKLCTKTVENKIVSGKLLEGEPVGIMNYNTFGIVGYRMLKLQNDGIITACGGGEFVYVKINKEKTTEEIESYLKNARWAMHFINVIEQYEKEGKQTEARSVMKSIAKKSLNFCGNTDFYEKSFKVATYTLWAGICVAFYPAVTKFVLGIFNGKPVKILFYELVVAMVALILINKKFFQPKKNSYKEQLMDCLLKTVAERSNSGKKLYYYLSEIRNDVGCSSCGSCGSYDNSSFSCGSSCGSCSSCSSCGGCGND